MLLLEGFLEALWLPPLVVAGMILADAQIILLSGQSL